MSICAICKEHPKRVGFGVAGSGIAIVAVTVSAIGISILCTNGGVGGIVAGVTLTAMGGGTLVIEVVIICILRNRRTPKKEKKRALELELQPLNPYSIPLQTAYGDMASKGAATYVKDEDLVSLKEELRTKVATNPPPIIFKRAGSNQVLILYPSIDCKKKNVCTEEKHDLVLLELVLDEEDALEKATSFCEGLSHQIDETHGELTSGQEILFAKKLKEGEGGIIETTYNTNSLAPTYKVVWRTEEGLYCTDALNHLQEAQVFYASKIANIPVDAPNPQTYQVGEEKESDDDNSD